MPKRKERDGIEFYRGKVRELQKENIALKKQVRQLQKTEHLYEDVILGNKDAAFEEKVYEPHCIHCGKGRIKTLNILDRIFQECDVCDYRKKIGGP